jgi:hypothetical protein
VEIRDNRETLLVNYLYMQIWNQEKGNVRLLAGYGRGRWKIENEHNNVLKNRGYNLEHNFGACQIFCVIRQSKILTLILPSFFQGDGFCNSL